MRRLQTLERERETLSKRAAKKFDMARLNIKMPNCVEVKEQCQIEITNRSAGYESLDGNLKTRC
jgi:hypothetical protein